jgi:hypothetical protein
MTKRDKQSKDEAQERDEAELDDARLEDVKGGTSFLTGSLTSEHGATAWVNPGGNENGFIMKDSIIVRTSGR